MMPAITPARMEPESITTSSAGWMTAAMLLTVALIAHSRTIPGLIGSWFDPQGDMGHGLLVPAAVAYMVWNLRSVLRSLPARPSITGVVLVILTSCAMLLGTAAQWTWVTRMSLVFGVASVVLALRGWQTIRVLAYPLGTLVLMVAPPTFVYERITMPLQLLASQLGEIPLEVRYAVV